MDSKTSQLIDEFNGLTTASKSRALTAPEAQRLELVHDVLVELEALPSPPARKVVLVSLLDQAEQVAVVELLRQAGIRVETPPASARPAIAVVDTSTALAFAGAPLVLMNVSGPDALMGQLARLEPAAFVKRRAPIAEVLDAVKGLLAATT
jgi:hypothetical protein